MKRGTTAMSSEANRHTADEHCDVDPTTDMCRGCGVHHGEACGHCGGRGFHRDGCATTRPAPQLSPRLSFRARNKADEHGCGVCGGHGCAECGEGRAA